MICVDLRQLLKCLPSYPALCGFTMKLGGFFMDKEKQAPLKLAYNRREAAAATGVTLAHISDAISRGTLPAKKFGREWIVLASDLQTWLKQA